MDDLKAAVCQAIDEHRDEVIAMAEDIQHHPELGFKEFRTAAIVQRTFERLGLATTTGLAITGVRGDVAGDAGDGPAVAILGELDALPVPSHPLADPVTGAAHACGHFAQIGMLLGCAFGLCRPGILDRLGGRLVFMAVPAEEAVEVEWRLQLRREGKIEFLGGKQELIRLGAFDDVDLALITHSSGRPETRKLELGGTNNGHLIKQVRYTGKAAHAGSAPQLGINALKAAMLGLAGIDAQRETFRDEDTIRIHPIITKGGESVNAVPDDVRIETYIRGARLEAIGDANVKVDRSLRAGSLAIGAKVDITTVPGYLPLVHDPLLAELFEENAVALVGREDVTHAKHGSYCTDTGDLSHVVRLAHPFAGGATGVHHSAAFAMTDPELAIINPAKVMAMCAVDLLRDEARSARAMLAAGPAPRFTKEQYLGHLRSLAYEASYDDREAAPPAARPA